MQEEPEEEPRDAPAFDFYCERWTHGTRHMTKVERCDYLDLLLHQWTEDGLPADLDMLARLVGYRKGSQISPLVLEKLPIAADGKRRNARLEKERVKQRVRIRGKKRGAAKTNAKRWGKGRASVGLPGDVPRASPGESLCESHNVSLSDPSATAGRDDIDSPPPTTHHPPQGELAEVSKLPSGGSAWPRTEEEARTVAANIGADPDYVAAVWREHDGTGDYTRPDASGARLLIRNFASYVKGRWGYRNHRRHEATALEKTKAELRRQGAYGSNGNGHGHGSRVPTRDERGQRAGEIPTDVHVDKIKRYGTT